MRDFKDISVLMDLDTLFQSFAVLSAKVHPLSSKVFL